LQDPDDVVEIHLDLDDGEAWKVQPEELEAMLFLWLFKTSWRKRAW
jgi:hypothetical protein